jgi:HD-like signal output (HDOD) protein/nitrogen-specific signal transduction histidine kinase
LTTKFAIDQLPSLPQVLVKILDAIHSDNADFQHIAEIIRQDAAMASKLLSVSNSSFYGTSKNCESVERALLFLGTDAVKTIVITASIKQFYGQFNQAHSDFLQRFWRRSLISANLAQVLATLTSYASPDEAYLCGLLADVGQLMLLNNDETAYLSILDQADNDLQLITAEQQHFNLDHCQQGADLVDSWQISGLMADAVRFHHEPGKLLLDAHQLVKIINLASALSVDGDIEDQALASADTLFGLNESLTRELRKRIGSDVESMAQNLGIDIHNQQTADHSHQQAHRQLGERLGELGELAQINTALAQQFSNDSLQNAAQRSVFLTLGITDSILFLLDDQQQLLCSQAPAENVTPSKAEPLDVKLPLINGRSLISDAFIQSQQLTSQTPQQPLSVIDRQLLRHCRSELLVCWPLITPTTPEQPPQKVGVLVFGCSLEQLQQLALRQRLSSQLCAQIASAISNNQQRLADIDQQGTSSDHYQQQIREAVHEASNPLTIIRNYLELLRIKLPEEHSANEGIGLIKEEIDRVGNILLRLNDPQQPTSADQINVNPVIKAIAHIFEDSLCATKNISLTLKLDSQLKSIPGDPEHLKQILTNLLKNAVEALPDNGSIQLSSETGVSFSGRNFVAINIADNGPGISDAIKAQLFSPVTSTKGAGHSGLGLSIIKKLIDDMDGSIMCRSSATSGTQFQLLLPT